MHPLLAELTWRELLYQQTEPLNAALSAGVVTGYCGFDPTAPSLHVGSLVPVMGLAHLQRAGHRPIVLIGGGTGMIGDPSGKTSERQLNTPETVTANSRAIQSQLERFLDFTGAKGAIMRDNAEWLMTMGAVEFMRDVGKHFTVSYMMQKESVRARMEEGGISYTEFSYMLLQARDFLELYRRTGCTLQMGGSDQWGNITAGIELIRRVEGVEAHALTLPHDDGGGNEVREDGGGRGVARPEADVAVQVLSVLGERRRSGCVEISAILYVVGEGGDRGVGAGSRGASGATNSAAGACARRDDTRAWRGGREGGGGCVGVVVREGRGRLAIE